VSDPRRASDDFFIRLLREGLHDAEIGVRLGITTGEVRARKADLRGKLGDAEFNRLLDPSRPMRRTRKWRKPAAILGTVAAAVALLLVVANLVVGGEEEIAPTRTSASPTPRPTPKPAAAIQVDGQAFDDAGVFVSLGTTAAERVGDVENRPGLTVVALTETAFLSANEFVQWARVGGARGQLRLRGTLNERQVELQVTAGNQSTRLRSLTASVGPVAEVSSQFGSMTPGFFLRAYDGSGRQLQARLENDGRLLIARETFPADWVIDRATGQRMEMSDVVTVGRLSIPTDTGASNVCRDTIEGLRCTVNWKGGVGMLAEIEGAAECSDTTQTFVTATVRIEMTRKSGSACRVGHVTPGLPIAAAGDWEMRAQTLDYEPLSFAVTSGGKFVAGRANGEIACPCLFD
jgi:hypothetical protein